MTRTDRLVLAFLANARQLEPAGRFVRSEIEKATGLTYEQAKRACRSLVDKQLVCWERPTWTWDGKPVGGGYYATTTNPEALGA